MYRIDPAWLLWVLEGLLDSQVVNQIIVPEVVQRDAQMDLDRMLQLKQGS